MTPLAFLTRAELEQEVTHLRHELSLMREERLFTALRKAFRLTPVETRFLMALYDAKGEPLTAWALENLSPSPSGLERASNVVAVFISRLRGSIGRTAIDTVWNRGWAMTPVGLATVDKALSDAGVTL